MKKNVTVHITPPRAMNNSPVYHPAYFQHPRQLVLRDEGEAEEDERRMEVALPDDGAMIEFKLKVQEWMRLEREIKAVETSLKEKKASKLLLTQGILQFMGRFNVEDLNTRDGRLRYKVTQAIAPLSQKTIRTRLAAFLEAKFSGKDDSRRVIEEADNVVFQRDRVEKVSLRRLKL